MEQKIIWTALPKGVVQVNGKTLLHLSVRVSPRLIADGVNGSLGDFPLFSSHSATDNWAGQKLTFNVQFGAGSSGNIIWGESLPASFSDERDPAVWNAVFPLKTPVTSFQFRDFSNFRVRSFPVKSLTEYIKGVYQQAGVTSPSDLPAFETRMVIENERPVVRKLIPFGLSEILIDHDACEKNLTAGWQHGPHSKVTETVDDFYQAVKFHEFKGDTQGKPIEPKKLEFHEMITMMEDYRPVMKKLGLVFDLLCDPPAHVAQWIKVTIPDLNGAAQFVSPATAVTCHLAKGVFEAVPKAGSELRSGLLDLAPPNYGLTQVDVDGAVLKLADFVRNMSRTIAKGQAAMDAPGQAALPSLRTGGLSVFRSNRDASMYQKMVAAAQMNSDATGSGNADIALYADDLVRGYRVDILDVDHAERWLSLCGREEQYRFKNADTLVPFQINGESTVTSTVVKDSNTPTDLYLHEALFHWDGWSLAARRPGKSVPAPDSGSGYVGPADPAIDPDLGLNVQCKPLKSSLPRLRFGRSYRLRARTVDITGDSRPPCKDADLTCASAETVYRRFEPIASPILAAGKKFDDKAPGESMERMVIRNYDAAETTDETVRHVLPPRTSQHMAELHGMFDTPPPQGTWYGILKDRHGDQAHLPEIVAHPFDDVPYLPDPMAGNAVVRGFPLVSDVLPIDFGTTVWPSAAPFRITLRDGAQGLSWDAAKRILYVSLPKAETACFRLSTAPGGEDRLADSAIWDWLTQALSKQRLIQMKELALKGGHWMISPFRAITLVHAVQKPLKPALLNDMTLHRALGNTFVEFRNDVRVHGKSTGRVDIRASWSDRKVSCPDDTGNNWSEHTGQPFSLIIDDPERDTVDCSGQRHDFGDTRYRKVTYKAVATSRFREYYDQTLDFTCEGPPVELHVLNAARPSAPVVEYIIPTFTWEQAQSQDGNMAETERRRLNGLRVYLKSPWHVSGDGELLGIVIAQGPDAQTTTNLIPNALKNLVTQWGADPIRISGPTYFAPTIHHFPDAAVEEPGITLEEAQSKPQDPSSWWLSVVGHKVEFDAERKLWYSDISIDAGPSYFPFVRLALVRYQPMSVRGAQVSKVTLADFIQLTPDRHAWVRTTPDNPQLIQVSVSGIAPLATNKKTEKNLVFVRAEMLHPDGETWLPVTPIRLPLVRTQITAPFTVWNGLVPLPLPRDERAFRLVIEEYESHSGDTASRDTQETLPVASGQSTSDRVRKIGRLVYADAIPL